jgi:hypothetical protein
MAGQLLGNPIPSAYAKVEAFARRHPGSLAAGLAWPVSGYAHLLGRAYAQAIAALKQAQPRACYYPITLPIFSLRPRRHLGQCDRGRNTPRLSGKIILIFFS